MRKSLTFYLYPLIFSFFISIPLILPYLHSGYFPTHDGEWAVVRLSDMFRELRDLQIPARYSGNLNFGYGYPLFNFAYPLPYYIGVLVHFLGFGFVDTIKVLFASTVPLSAFFMFIVSRKIWGSSLAAVISSILYLYFPYRLVDLFVRGSIGESFAFVFFPLILYSLFTLSKNPESAFQRILGAVSYAALILSHNIMAVLFTLSLIFFAAGSIAFKNVKVLKSYLFVGILGLLLSAFFFVPALLEKGNILLSKVPIADRYLYFVSIRDLFLDTWGYGVPTEAAGFSYQLGWPFVIVIITILSLIIYFFAKRKKVNSLVLALTIGFFVFAFLLLRQSWVFWKLPLLSEINYPWTVLSQLGLLASLLGGYLALFKYTRIIAVACVIIALFLFIPLAKPSSYFDKGDDFYITNDATTTSSKELMPLWVKEFPSKRSENKAEIIEGAGSIDKVSFNSKSTIFTANLEENSKIRINTIYYPGWEVLVNNEKQQISYDNKKGVMELNLSEGNHLVFAKFSETLLRMMSNLISAAAFVFVLIVGLKPIIKK